MCSRYANDSARIVWIRHLYGSSYGIIELTDCVHACRTRSTSSRCRSAAASSTRGSRPLWTSSTSTAAAGDRRAASSTERSTLPSPFLFTAAHHLSFRSIRTRQLVHHPGISELLALVIDHARYFPYCACCPEPASASLSSILSPSAPSSQNLFSRQLPS